VVAKWAPRSLFARNILVTYTDLVPDKDDNFEEVSISLRGRDLWYAVLDHTDMHRADLTDANLRWSSLNNTQLGKANLVSAKLQGANLNGAELPGVDLRDTVIWQTAPTVEDRLKFAYLTDAKITPLTDDDRKGLQRLIAEAKETSMGADFKNSLEQLLMHETVNRGDSDDGKACKLQRQ
jgi:uncharacterized protein YjbI with pentapeptide repeats